MRRLMFVLLIALMAVGLSSTSALAAGKGRGQQQKQRSGECPCQNCGYVDANGDGICDNCGAQCGVNARDDDGDGVPNGQDPDYVPPKDGSGRRAAFGHRGAGRMGQGQQDRKRDGSCGNCGFVDADGDGICDNCGAACNPPRDGTGKRRGLGRGR